MTSNKKLLSRSISKNIFLARTRIKNNVEILAKISTIVDGVEIYVNDGVTFRKYEFKRYNEQLVPLRVFLILGI